MNVIKEATQLHGNAIEEVNEFPYLVFNMTSDGHYDAEIKERLSRASQVFGMLKTICKAGKLEAVQIHYFLIITLFISLVPVRKA